MILLCGVASEAPLAAVRNALQRIGQEVAVYDQRGILETEIELTVDGSVKGTLRTDTDTVDLEAVTAAYIRLYDARELPGVAGSGPQSDAWSHALAVDDCLSCWAELTPALVVNRLSAMASNSSKPFQEELIRELGFCVPETIVTTDVGAVIEFQEFFGEIIYKSVSGVRSVVSRLKREDRDRLADISWCPTQFQEYVPGTDFRVHIVGSEVFACRVVSEADDYRYAARQGMTLEIEPANLPPKIAGLCHALTCKLGLSVAGVDLRLTPDGQWYCFEVNPSPAFTYYQAWSGQPIDEAIATLLTNGPNSAQ